MRITFKLAWTNGPVGAKHFKSAASYALFAEYLERISHFAPSDACGIDLKRAVSGRAVRWFCHSSRESKAFSSPELARLLEKVRQGGRDLEIVIGPADGFTAQDLKDGRPDLLWSFGPPTLPHELAAVVASEQVYRAFTILANQPYHSGH